MGSLPRSAGVVGCPSLARRVVLATRIRLLKGRSTSFAGRRQYQDVREPGSPRRYPRERDRPADWLRYTEAAAVDGRQASPTWEQQSRSGVRAGSSVEQAREVQPALE